MAMVIYQGPIPTNSEGKSDTSTGTVEKGRFVGLSNQGATCYLNGLLQTLFMTPDFRRAIFAWNYDKEKDGKEELCIPLQLQRLFGLLQLGKEEVVDTVALTKSFGWEGSEVFQQQDVQELTRVLFDALEVSFKGTSVENIIDELYAGQLIDYLRCIDVDYESQRVDKFLDFSLAIVPFGSNKPMRNLKECIEMYLRPEILNGENKYYAEKFNMKVDAIKGLKFGKLPQIMSVQLKRFVYDFSGPNIVQKKLNDVVKFPMILDMNKYVATLKKRKRGDEASQSSSGTGDETASAEAGGGCSSGSTTSDSSSDGSNSDEEPNEEFEAFLKHQLDVLKASEEENNSAGGSSANVGAPGTAGSGGVEGSSDLMDLDDVTSDVEDLDEDDDLPPLVDCIGQRHPEQIHLDNRKKILRAKRKHYESMTDEEVRHLLETRGEWIYELYAVLIHSGAISGGHYYAYIKDLNRKHWWNFNDSVVSPIDEKTVQETWGSNIKVTTTHNSTGYSGYTSMNPLYNPAPTTTTTTRLSSSNAYMLMYRKLSVDTISRVEYPSNECVPQYIRDQIKAEEEAQAELRRQEEEARNRMMIKVHWLGKDHMVETSKKKTLNELLLDLWNKLDLQKCVPPEAATTSLTSNEITASTALEDAGVENAKVGVGSDVQLPPHLSFFRLRNYTTHTKIMAEAYDQETSGDKALQYLGIFDYRPYCLEMRSSPDIPWEVYHVDGLSLLLEGYDSTSESFLEPRSIRLPKYSTVGDLRAAISKFVPYDISRIQICRFLPCGVSDARMEVYSSDNHRLREDLHLYEGQSVWYEERTWGPEVLNMSLAFARYLDNRNRISVLIRQVNSSIVHTVTIDLRWRVQEMRKHVAEVCGLDPEYMRLFKFTEKGQELKDGDIVGHGSVYSGLSIFVSQGKPTPSGHCAIELYLYEPLEKVRVVSLPSLPPDTPMEEDVPEFDDSLNPELLRAAGIAAVPSSSSASSSSSSAHHGKVSYNTSTGGEQSSVSHSHLGDLTKNIDLHRAIDAINVEAYESSGLDDSSGPSSSKLERTPPPPPALIPPSSSSGGGQHFVHPSPAVVAASYMAQSMSHGSDQDTDNLSTDGIADCEDCGDMVLGQELSREELETRELFLDHASMKNILDMDEDENIHNLVPKPPRELESSLLDHYTAAPAEIQPGSVILLPDAPVITDTVDSVHPSAFGQLTVSNNFPGDKIYKSLDCLKDFSVRNDTLISDLAQTIVDRLIQNGILPEGTSRRRLRIRDKVNSFPGRILFDGGSFADNRLALSDHKALIIQILDQEESIGSVMESGDSVIYFQRWHRSTWSMGERMEILLRGSMTVRDVARSLAVLTDVPLDSMLVMVMPREIEVYLSDLVEKSTVYNYGRSWFDPTKETKLLKYMSHEFRVQDSNLLLIQDRSEPLMQLSPADLKSIDLVRNASSATMADDWPSAYATVYNSTNIGSYPSSGASSYSYQQTAYSGTGARVANTGGIRIKTRLDRMKEMSSDKLADNVSVNSGSNPLDGTTDTSSQNNVESYDTREFHKQGGYALFADMD